MSKYQVFITNQAQKDLSDLSFYITEILKSPLAAMGLEIELIESILSLGNKPHRVPVFSESVVLVSDKVIWKLIIRSYLILFFINEEQSMVNIVAVYNRLMDN